MSPAYGPPDASDAPRYTGVRTFARCPHVTDHGGRRRRGRRRPVRHRHEQPARRAVRPGGDPRRPRSGCGRTTRRSTWTCSARCRWSTGATSTSRPATPSAPPARSPPASSRWSRAGVVPLVLGGDHSIVLGELRAQAAVHGPVALVLLDAHADTWDELLRRALLPRHAVPARGGGGPAAPGALAAGGHARAALLGVGPRRRRGSWASRSSSDDELRAMDTGRLRAPRAGAVGDAPAFFSFDIDVIDPAFAPGTGTPEVAGLMPREALALIRSLAGHAVHRLRRGRGVAALRRPGRDDGAARGRDRLRVPGADRGRAGALRELRRCHRQARALLAEVAPLRAQRALRGARLRLRWHLLRGDSYLRFPVNGNLLEALDEGRAEIGPWVLIERGLLVRALSRDGDDAHRRGHDPQPRLHGRRDRADRDRRATACSPTTASWPTPTTASTTPTCRSPGRG